MQHARRARALAHHELQAGAAVGATTALNRAVPLNAAEGLQGGNDIDDAGIVERAVVFKHSKGSGSAASRTPPRAQVRERAGGS